MGRLLVRPRGRGYNGRGKKEVSGLGIRLDVVIWKQVKVICGICGDEVGTASNSACLSRRSIYIPGKFRWYTVVFFFPAIIPESPLLCI